MRSARTLIVLIALIAAPAAHGANRTWNNGSADSLWNGTSLNWVEAPFIWVSGDEAIFGTTGVGSVTVDPAGVTATSLTFNTAGYTIGGGTITLDYDVEIAGHRRSEQGVPHGAAHQEGAHPGFTRESGQHVQRRASRL